MLAGFISPLDCFIHVTLPLNTSRDWMSTALHEYVHYLQYISTPVGCQIRVRQQWLASDMLVYLHNQKQPLQMGVIGPALFNSPETVPNPLTLRVKDRLAENCLFNGPFITLEGLALFDACFPSPTLSDDEAYQGLLKNRPIDVDYKTGCFYLKTSGKRVPVSATCIMEYMACLFQLMHDGCFSSRESLFRAIRDRNRAHYNLPLIFLVQEGILENPFGWPFLYRVLMILMRTALLIDPLAMTASLAEKHKLGPDFLPQSLFLRAVEYPEMLDFGLFSNLASKSNCGSSSTPNRDFADFLLKSAGWPSVAELLECFEADINDNIDLASNRSRAQQTMARATQEGTQSPFDVHTELLPRAEMRKRQFETFKVLCFRTWETDDNIVDPMSLCNEAPKPMFAEYREEGVALSRNGLQEGFWDAQYEHNTTMTFHICQQILFSPHIACYVDQLGETAMCFCPCVNACVRASEKQGLEFCRSSVWKDMVTSFLMQSHLRIR